MNRKYPISPQLASHVSNYTDNTHQVRQGLKASDWIINIYGAELNVYPCYPTTVSKQCSMKGLFTTKEMFQ